MDKNRGNKMTVKLVSNEKIAETSSKGNQEKWFDKETNKWYKLDQFGYEALAETLISRLLEKSNLSSETPFSFAKYSFVIFTTTPDSRNTAIRLGMTMSPLKVSAMLHISPRFIVAPTIAVREYSTMKGMLEREPKRNSIHLVPYSPQPMIVEKAKQHIATAVKIDTHNAVDLLCIIIAVAIRRVAQWGNKTFFFVETNGIGTDTK